MDTLVPVWLVTPVTVVPFGGLLLKRTFSGGWRLPGPVAVMMVAPGGAAASSNADAARAILSFIDNPYNRVVPPAQSRRAADGSPGGWDFPRRANHSDG